jgi:rod shape-determining protein MreC
MRSLILFLWKQRFFLLFFLLELIAISMLVNNSSFHRSNYVSTANELTGNMFQTWGNLTRYFSLQKTNEALVEENTALRNQLKSSYLKLDTTTVLIDDTLFRQHYRYQKSKVLSNSFQKRNNYLIISKGRKHGYTAEMGVVSQGGVVGIINEVSDNFSSVISILHSQSAIGAKLQKSGYSGTLTWNGKDYKIGQLDNIPSHVKIQVGDTVVTSGFSFVFPEGLLLGTIADFEEIPGKGLYKIKLRFGTEFNQLEFVYVISNLLKEEEKMIRESNLDE